MSTLFTGLLVTHLAESVEDSIRIRTSRDRRHALHLGKGSGGSGNDISESRDDLREWSLTNDDQGAVDDGDALSGSLEGLALLSDHSDVADDLGGGRLGKDRDGHGHGGGEELGEGDHFG